VRRRVVLDTNIYISAVLFGGRPDQLLSLARSDLIEVIVSPPILDEVARVLSRKFEFSRRHVSEVIREILSLAEVVAPTQRVTLIQEDDDDNRFLECAECGKADFIVSGDRHLIAIGSFGNIPILAPVHFLNIV